MSDQVTVICLEGRCGRVNLSKGDPWTIPVEKAARLIAAGQVRLQDPADAAKLPKVETVRPVEAAPPVEPVQVPTEVAAAANEEPSEDDEFDEDGAVNADADAPGEPQTALAKAKAKRESKPKANAAKK